MSRHELRSRELTRSTAALFALFIGAFSVGMAEFVIAGILPQLADALRVGTGAAGLLVTVYALGVAVGGPLLTAAARRLSRKAVLIRSMIIFITASVVSAMPPDHAHCSWPASISAADMSGNVFAPDRDQGQRRSHARRRGGPARVLLGPHRLPAAKPGIHRTFRR